MAKALMFLGTASECGKSVLATAFCRILTRKNIRVAPFKAQNMALNSGVTPDGLEMGRAQIVQAEAACIEPHVDMNPILLKPTSEKGSQVIVHGIVRESMNAACYYKQKKSLWSEVTKSYDRLARQFDVIVLEGAGSPVEINLKENDIVNMAMADYADASVVLVADIDRGGVFASILGTVELLTPAERNRIIGFIINKFRGDMTLIQNGMQFIRERTGYPVLGILPLIRDLYIPGEDSVALDTKCVHQEKYEADIAIGVIRFPHISNYTDFDPFICDPRFSVDYLQSAKNLRQYDLIILPGSKNVFADYLFLVDRGFQQALLNYYRNGGKIVGVCGGFQMLGESISDPYGVESVGGNLHGLGLLPVLSVMTTSKMTERVRRKIRLPGLNNYCTVEGYEIHMGKTTLTDIRNILYMTEPPYTRELSEIAFGDGRVWGTYVHGLFESDELRDDLVCWIQGTELSEKQDRFSYRRFKDINYTMLADSVEKHIDVSYVLKRIGIR